MSDIILIRSILSFKVLNITIKVNRDFFLIVDDHVQKVRLISHIKTQVEAEIQLCRK